MTQYVSAKSKLSGELVHQGGSRSLGATVRDKWVWLALISTALPSIYETEWKIELGPGSLYLADLALFGAALASIKVIRSTPAAGLIASVALIAGIVGIVNGATVSWVIRDSRPMLYMLAGMAIGRYIFLHPRSVRFGCRATIWLIGITAALAAMSQLTSIPIIGNEAGAVNAVYYNGEKTFLAARRVQSEPVPLALLTFCILCSSWILRYRISDLIGRNYTKFAILASALLTTLAYSRNSIVGIVVALTLSVLISHPSTRATRLGRVIALGATTSVLVGLPVWIGYQYGLFKNVIDTFSGRVLAGIAPEVIATDPSVGWRFVEMRAAWSYILQHPVFGTGFGAFYRPRIADEPFIGDQGRLYLHNYFALLGVKFGIVCGLLLLVAFLISAIRMVRAGDQEPSGFSEMWPAIACGFIAMLVVSAVAPVMYSRSFIAFGGCLLACGLSLRDSSAVAYTHRRWK